MAEALLKADVLRSSDWQGDLDSTVYQGLIRYLHVDCGVSDLPLSCRFCYTDDAARQMRGMGDFSMATGQWWRGPARKRDVPVPDRIGAFGLIGEAFQSGAQEYIVGRRVARLEEISKGAGYAALLTAVEAMSPVVDVFTPATALAHGDYMDGLNSTMYFAKEKAAGREIKDKTKAPHGPGVTELLEKIPLEACHGMNEDVVRRNLRRGLKLAQAGCWESWQIEILTEALEIHDLWRKLPNGIVNHIGAFEDETLCQVMVRWCEDDPVSRFFDDYNEYHTTQYSWTHWCWAFFWDWNSTAPDDPASLSHAIKVMTWAFRLLSRGARLLSLLHQDDRLATRVRVGTF